MPRRWTPQDAERADIRYLKQLAKGPLGSMRLSEQFEEVGGVLHRRMAVEQTIEGITPADLMALVRDASAGMIRSTVMVTVEIKEDYGAISAVLIVRGRRKATPKEIAVYDEVHIAARAMRDQAQAERDEQTIADLRRRKPELFKES